MLSFLTQDGNCEAYTVINSSTSGIPGKKRRNYAGGKPCTIDPSLSLILLRLTLIKYDRYFLEKVKSHNVGCCLNYFKNKKFRKIPFLSLDITIDDSDGRSIADTEAT